MKKVTHIFYLFLATTIIFVSCSKDDDGDESTLPVVTTGAVASIKADSALFVATVVDEGATAVTKRGFCWSTHTNPAVSDNLSENAFGHGAYTHSATGLSSNTIYYVKSYATNGNGTAYGNIVAFRTKFKIGDPGPAGGYVFYLNSSGGGLEAAPELTEGVVDWGCPTTLIGGTLLGVETGNDNTNLILNGCAQVLSAATLCNDLVSGGKTDWYLPSQEELNLMYINLHLAGQGSFGSFRYWSSSEFNATNAWRHDFDDGAQLAANKGIAYRVRAIRSF